MSKLIIIIIKSIGTLPISLRKQLGNLMGAAVFFLLKNERAIARLQLEKIFSHSDPQKTAKKVFQSIGSNILLSFNLKPLLKRSGKIISVSNSELFDELKNSPQAVIALTAHTGNWDLLAAYTIQQEIPLVTIGRSIRNATIQDVLKNLRATQGITTLWRDSLKSGRKLIELAKSGGTIAALIDQDTKVKSINSTFFSIPCKTPIGLIELGLKTNARFVTAFMFEKENGDYILYLNEIKNTDIQVIVDKYHLDLENALRAHPEQWVWFHKRWRTQNGKTMSSKEYLNYLNNL